jgi:hypothetical protein
MNVITNSVFIFIFVFVSLVIGIPGTEDNNIIKNKIFLFGGLFIFQMMLKFVYKIRYRCTDTNLKFIVNDSLLIGTYGIIGYSLFIDMLNMENTRNIILPYTKNLNSHALLISTIISVFIMMCIIISYVITGKHDTCENKNNVFL